MTSTSEPFSSTSPTSVATGAALQQPVGCPREHCNAIADGQAEIDRLTRAQTDLRQALAREHQLLKQTEELVEKQILLSREASHRLLNSLQLVSSLLFLQGRQSPDPAISAQLNVAARRVSAIGNVHRRLHAMDHADIIELKPYLSGLCEDITGLLPDEGPEPTLHFEGIDIKVSNAIGIPLGLIVSELITNAVKYANGKITVSLIKHPLDGFALTVSDDGPGLPAEFDPKNSKGLGMSIISSLTAEIHGELLVAGNAGRGACFTILFKDNGIPPAHER